MTTIELDLVERSIVIAALNRHIKVLKKRAPNAPNAAEIATASMILRRVSPHHA